jgi:hypothetical protein
MPTWKRLIQNLSIPVEIDVNMDTVAMMVRAADRNYTKLTFIFASAENRYAYSIDVKETPDEIHRMAPLPER